MNQREHHRMWKNIPMKRRFEMKETIDAMEEGLDKLVLQLLFIEDMSTREAAEYLKEHNTGIGRQFKPIGSRRIQQISKTYFPDLYEYTPKSAHMRAAHRELTVECAKKCAICQSEKDIEMHHMIPLFLGGTTEKENCISLCRNCHTAVTQYQKSLFPEHFVKRKYCKRPDGNEQLRF